MHKFFIKNKNTHTIMLYIIYNTYDHIIYIKIHKYIITYLINIYYKYNTSIYEYFKYICMIQKFCITKIFIYIVNEKYISLILYE